MSGCHSLVHIVSRLGPFTQATVVEDGWKDAYSG